MSGLGASAALNALAESKACGSCSKHYPKTEYFRRKRECKDCWACAARRRDQRKARNSRQQPTPRIEASDVALGTGTANVKRARDAKVKGAGNAKVGEAGNAKLEEAVVEGKAVKQGLKRKRATAEPAGGEEWRKQSRPQKTVKPHDEDVVSTPASSLKDAHARVVRQLRMPSLLSTRSYSPAADDQYDLAICA